MDFRFTPQEEALRQEVRKFIAANIDPSWPGDGDGLWDDRDQPTWAMVKTFHKKLAQKGWLAISWPKEFGGSGRSLYDQAIVIEEIAYAGAPAIDLAVTFVGPAIMQHGSPAQRARILPPIARGEVTYCEGLSEPGAGSDLANMKTTAVRDGDNWVINGHKVWTSVAHCADYCWVAARTDPNVPQHRGLSCFLVDVRNTPGITIRPIINMIGVHSFNEVFFDNVKAPLDTLVGEENKGWYQIMTTLDYERAVFGGGLAMCAALTKHLRELVDYAGDHRRNGSLLMDDPIVRHKLADLAVDIGVARALSYRVMWMQANGKVPNAEVSMVKLHCSHLSQRLANVAMDLTGLYGQLGRANAKYAPMRGQPVMSWMTSIAHTIGAGTSEIQRNIIAGRGLGLPRG